MTQQPYKICPDCVARFDDLEQEYCPTHNKRLLLVAPSQDSLVGTTLSERFTLTEQLGKGGFGSVYRAIQHPIDREVAVKVLHREHAESELQVKRFFNEGRLISALRNQHTIQLYDFGQTDDGLLYMAIEFSPGHVFAP